MALGTVLPAAVVAQQTRQQDTKPAADAPQQQPPLPEPATDPKGDAPVMSDKDFNAALPPISGDINAPLEPMPQVQPFTPETANGKSPTAAAPATPQTAPSASVPTAPAPGTLPPVAERSAELAQPLPSLESFNTVPVTEVADVKAGKTVEIAYDTVVNGLGDVGLDDEFKGFSALRKGKGKAANVAQITARAREDEALAVRLLKSIGYYDGSAVSVIETIPNDATRVRATINATPGKVYRFRRVTADPTHAVVPDDLITRNLPLKPGEAIVADRVQGAEANLTLKLGQNGYPFATLGTRDILLDEQTLTGDYTLPLDPGPRATFAGTSTRGHLAFDAEHILVLRRYKAGDLYDTRKVDDLRKALVATGLFETVTVEPVRTGQPGPDGTEQVNLRITQRGGKTRSIAATGGYSTGQGIRSEVTYTARNAFPPEGALIVGAVGGTQEQSGSVTFRRSNAGRRDRTVTLGISAGRQDYDAFNAITGTLFGRISYDSTPIWQKKFTWAYGFELTATNESVYNFNAGKRDRGTYFIAALPGQVAIDTSDDLLNPTRGFRAKLTLSPESSVRGSFRPYVRTMLDVSGYYPVTDSMVIAARERAGSVIGIARDNLAPSRRYYGGGGGSVRGYGYQRLGPFDPNGDPVGGRSVNEFALEARYRFGNFGVVPFFDAGNSYASVYPTFSDLRYGAGIGARYYTNFGPLRIDVATPINKRKGDSLIALYISIGQAF